MYYECGEEAGIQDIKEMPVQYTTLEILTKASVKSAVEGLIKFHEDRVEKFIGNMVLYGTQLLDGSIPYIHQRYIDLKMLQIQQEYESIMTIEYWLEDVIK